ISQRVRATANTLQIEDLHHQTATGGATGWSGHGESKRPLALERLIRWTDYGVVGLLAPWHLRLDAAMD
ncbi:MAG: hypothetical protein ACK2T5_11815, partial [Anaerolineales bacterium]